jgi:hypothetical protein
MTMIVTELVSSLAARSSEPANFAHGLARSSLLLAPSPVDIPTPIPYPPRSFSPALLEVIAP